MTRRLQRLVRAIRNKRRPRVVFSYERKEWRVRGTAITFTMKQLANGDPRPAWLPGSVW